MPKLIPAEQWEDYFRYRDSMGMREAARKAGINPSSAHRLENIPGYNSSGRVALLAWRERDPGRIPSKQSLNSQARRALDDFAAWRLRYIGRRSMPWQIRAANVVLRAHEQAQASMDRKFIVINCPPGSGKSSLFTHDIPLWLICRDRSIRILIGSATETLARGYTEQIMTSLERTEPPPLEPAQARRGAIQAVGCLVEDYGRFKPDNGRNWRTGAFKVAHENDQAGTAKEATVSAFGRDSSYLGQRPDIAIWDDLVTEETSGTGEARERTLRKWQREAEQRVEPGGVLILQGQRLFADDLYRYCIDLPGGDDTDEDEPDDGRRPRKYTHIVFKAHYEEHCTGDHGKDAKPYDPANPANSGCLLDPVGLSWRFLRQIQRDDENQGGQTYRIVFQQEDGDVSRALVNPLWVDGGTDPKTGEMFRGCWDNDRATGVVPPINLPVSVVSIDSSPANYWSVQWWMYEPKFGSRYLIDMVRSKMKVTDAISYDKLTGRWTGVLEDWWQNAARQNAAFTHVIFEIGSAERYFLQQNDFKDWASMRHVTAMAHDTKKNKNDPLYGVQGLLPPIYRAGLVRIPGDVRTGSKSRMMPLVREVTHWPDTVTFDCGMSQWFFEHNLPNLVRSYEPLPQQPRPEYVRKMAHRRLVAVGSR